MIARRNDIERQMFPSTFWFTRFSSWKPIWKGSDEWGRHTICIGIPFLLHVVIPTKPCDCEDMAEFACTFPGCPYTGFTTDDYCMTHHAEMWDAEVTA